MKINGLLIYVFCNLFRGAKLKNGQEMGENNDIWKQTAPRSLSRSQKQGCKQGTKPNGASASIRGLLCR
jgi:hypothetical protein